MSARITDWCSGPQVLQPGSLVDEATIVQLDAKKICFNLQLQVDGAHVNLATPQGWNAELSGYPTFNDYAATFSDSIERKTDVQQGEKLAVDATTMQTVCDPNGANCVTKQRVEARAKTTNVNVSSGAGSVCFANKGYVTKETTELTLTLTDPTSSMHSIMFRWQFTDAQGQAQR